MEKIHLQVMVHNFIVKKKVINLQVLILCKSSYLYQRKV